jgi:drug/metabolite transporter (DMT)-like permease
LAPHERIWREVREPVSSPAIPRSEPEAFPVPGEQSARPRGVLLVLTATVLWSTGGLFARALAPLDVWTVVGWRAALGAVSISAVGLVEWRRGRLDELFGFGSLSPMVAALATIAIAAYSAALMTTTIADVMVIYATIPFVAAALGWLVNRESIDRRTLAASIAAIAGVVVIFINGLGSGRLAGQELSALSTVAFAGMVVLQRRRPKASMTAVNAIGALGAGAIGPRSRPIRRSACSTSRCCSSTA